MVCSIRIVDLNGFKQRIDDLWTFLSSERIHHFHEAHKATVTLVGINGFIVVLDNVAGEKQFSLPCFKIFDHRVFALLITSLKY